MPTVQGFSSKTDIDKIADKKFKKISPVKSPSDEEEVFTAPVHNEPVAYKETLKEKLIKKLHK
jgi:hypothetical protein